MEKITDYYSNTRKCINYYNKLMHQIMYGSCEITDNEEEFLDNYCIYLAHALLKDTGPGAHARAELSKMCSVIKDVMIGDAYESKE